LESETICFFIKFRRKRQHNFFHPLRKPKSTLNAVQDNKLKFLKISIFLTQNPNRNIFKPRPGLFFFTQSRNMKTEFFDKATYNPAPAEICHVVICLQLGRNRSVKGAWQYQEGGGSKMGDRGTGVFGR